jgi:hypothetical protein
MSEELCACGQPLHYTNATTRAYVDRMIEALGPDVPVTVDGRTWLVQRHYIALHGLSAVSLKNFPEITVRADERS